MPLSNKNIYSSDKFYYILVNKVINDKYNVFKAIFE